MATDLEKAKSILKNKNYSLKKLSEVTGIAYQTLANYRHDIDKVDKMNGLAVSKLAEIYNQDNGADNMNFKEYEKILDNNKKYERYRANKANIEEVYDLAKKALAMLPEDLQDKVDPHLFYDSRKNGSDSDWRENSHSSKFMMFYDFDRGATSDNGAVLVYIYSNKTMKAWAFLEKAHEPTYTYPKEVPFKGDLEVFKEYLNSAALTLLTPDNPPKYIEVPKFYYGERQKLTDFVKKVFVKLPDYLQKRLKKNEIIYFDGLVNTNSGTTLDQESLNHINKNELTDNYVLKMHLTSSGRHLVEFEMNKNGLIKSWYFGDQPDNFGHYDKTDLLSENLNIDTFKFFMNYLLYVNSIKFNGDPSWF